MFKSNCITGTTKQNEESMQQLLRSLSDRQIVLDDTPVSSPAAGAVLIRTYKPLLDERRLQAGIGRPTEIVRVKGKVRTPGEYPLEPGICVSDLLRAGGNADPAVVGGKPELARRNVIDYDSRETDLIEIEHAAVRHGDVAADLTLKPFDDHLIEEAPNWTDQESVRLIGGVRFPGGYPIRTGGLTPFAFGKGSAFARQEMKERDQKQLDMLGQCLQSDLASLSSFASSGREPARRRPGHDGRPIIDSAAAAVQGAGSSGHRPAQRARHRGGFGAGRRAAGYGADSEPAVVAVGYADCV